eukprot:gene5482-6167_t
MTEVESSMTTTTVEETVTVISETTTTVTSDGTVTEVITTKTIEGGAGEDAVEGEVQVEQVKENGDAEAPKEEEKPAAEAIVSTEEQAAEKIEVQEEKKEEGPPKVMLHQYPPGKNTPSLSLFCLKLETFLRMNKIPYENVHSFKVGKKGKMPWIEYKGEKVPDSNFIIGHLNKMFDIDMEKRLSQVEKAQSRAFKLMMEENTYYTMVYNRFIDEYNEWKKICGAQSKGIGFTVSFKMSQRKARSTLDQQGIGRHSKEEIYHLAEQDLRALSDFLADKPYLMGAEVTSVDATAFGLLVNFLYSGLESPQSKLINEELKNLKDFVERMKSEFWPDWQDMVLGDKPEHTHIPRRFSFKRSKKKVREGKKDDGSNGDEKTEEAKADEKTEDAKTEEKAEDAKTEEKVEEPKEEETEAKPDETAEVNGEASDKPKDEAENKTE